MLTLWYGIAHIPSDHSNVNWLTSWLLGQFATTKGDKQHARLRMGRGSTSKLNLLATKQSCSPILFNKFQEYTCFMKKHFSQEKLFMKASFCLNFIQKSSSKYFSDYVLHICIFSFLEKSHSISYLELCAKSRGKFNRIFS